jgi:hypothetical protein
MREHKRRIRRLALPHPSRHGYEPVPGGHSVNLRRPSLAGGRRSQADSVPSRSGAEALYPKADIAAIYRGGCGFDSATCLQMFDRLFMLGGRPATSSYVCCALRPVISSQMQPRSHDLTMGSSCVFSCVIRTARGRCFSRCQIYRPAFGFGAGTGTAAGMQSSG